MPEIETPHFSYPFRWTTTSGKLHAAVEEQDDPQEIADCVEVVLRVPIGFREELPEFGSPSYLFDLAPLQTDELQHALQEWEPRAEIDISEHAGDTLDETIRSIRLAITPTDQNRES